MKYKLGVTTAERSHDRHNDRHGRDSRHLSFSAPLLPHVCVHLPLSLSPCLLEQISRMILLFLFQNNMIQTSEKLISLSKFSCLTASSDLTQGRQASLFAISFDLKTTHTMSVSIYE